MPNDDIFIFYKVDELSKDFDEILTIHINEKILTKTSLETFEIKKDFSPVVGIDITTLPQLYIETSNFSFLLGKQYYSKEIKKEYDTGESSVIRELKLEKSAWDFHKEENKLVSSINTDDCIIEGWVLFSKNKLFSNNDSIKYYAKTLNTSGNISAWLTSEGQYVKIPYSIDPFSKDAYGRNPGSNHGREELLLYEKSKERIYESLTYNKLKGLYNLPRHESGVWLTEYTST